MFQRFIIFSGLAALVNLAVGYVLYGVLGFADGGAYAVSVSIAFLAGMGVSFVFNRRYTYPASGRHMTSELRDFLLVSLGGMTLTTALAWGLDTYAYATLAQLTPAAILPETAAHIIAVGLTAFYSFFAHKLISFRADRAAAEASA